MDSASNAQSYDLVVTSNHQNNSGGGIVNILFYIGPDGSPKVPDPSIFKTGTCWVSSGYDENIESKFHFDELFLLKSARLQDKERTVVNTLEVSDWWAAGKNAERLSSQFIRIIEAELPNIDSGKFDWTGSELQRGSYFILSEGFIYGLFDLTKDTIDGRAVYTASPIANPAIRVDSHHVCKMDFNDLRKAGLIFDAKVNGEMRFYIGSLKSFGQALSNPKQQQIDYIPAKQLFSKVIAPLQEPKRKQKLLTKSQLNDLNGMISDFLNKNGGSLQAGSQRYQRAIDLVKSLNQSDDWILLIESYLKTPEGRSAFKSFSESSTATADKHRAAELNNDVEEAKGSLDNVNADIKIKTEARDIVEAQLELGKANLERQQVEHKEQIEQALTDKRMELETSQKNIDELNEKGSNLEKKYNKYITLEALEDKISQLEGSRTYLEGRENTLKEMLNSPEKSGDALLQVHSIMDLLGYARHTPKNKNQVIHQYVPPAKATNIEDISAIDLVASICKKIGDTGGRELSETETANILICMQQNLMIFLHGRPGKGKTSTALNLAKSLGIHKFDSLGREPDFLNVAVARGWSGSRDLIGFYNSLKDEFQASQTGLYNFLLDGEKLNKNSNIRIVLLDEANLSPIEHYFSSFISLFDIEGRNRAIDTGCINSDQRYLHPVRNNNLRFIATINNDSTTEPLSPRLLDRAPVISMDIDNNSAIGGEILSISGAIPANILEDKFGRKKCSNEIELRAIEDFVSKGTNEAPLLSDHLHLEGRRKIAIQSYIQAATGTEDLMERSLAEDFAVSQFLLPHFRGDGSNVAKAIEVMNEFSLNNNWRRTSEILLRIQREGDAYLHSYSFM